MEPWYVLYEGQSEDGYGNPTYAGRTTDPAVALKHYRDKICKLGSYAIGRVDRFTDGMLQIDMRMNELKNDIKAYTQRQAGITEAKNQLLDQAAKGRKLKPSSIPKPDNWGGFA